MTTVDNSAFGLETRAMPWWLILVEGILAIIIGVLLITSPATMVASFVIFLGLYWMIKGVFDLVSMFIDHTAWGWKLFMGIIGIVAGLVIVRHPLVSTVAVPAVFTWILGIYAIVAGIIMLIQSFRGAGWGAAVMGIIGILLGVFILGNILAATIAFVWLSAVVLIVGGIVAIVVAFRQRGA